MVNGVQLHSIIGSWLYVLTNGAPFGKVVAANIIIALCKLVAETGGYFKTRSSLKTEVNNCEMYTSPWPIPAYLDLSNASSDIVERNDACPSVGSLPRARCFCFYVR